MIWVTAVGFVVVLVQVAAAVWWTKQTVSKTAYDDIVRIADAEREHNRRLTRTILRLKVSQQAYLPAKAEVRQAREVDQIEAAIDRSRHAKDPHKRAALSSWAARERALGKLQPGEIVERLLHWDDIDAVSADDQDDDSETLLS